VTEETLRRGTKLSGKTTYEKWQEGERIPIVTGYHVEDLHSVALQRWERLGAPAAFINLQGSENTNGGYVCEIPPGGSLDAERHLYEELIYILSGHGGTAVWQGDGAKQSFEWQSGSLFSPPLNTWHQLFNGSGNEPVRFLAVTTAPLVLNIFHNMDFVFENGFLFTDRYNGDPDYFSQTKDPAYRNVWETNFVSDLRSFDVRSGSGRGLGVRSAHFELAGDVLGAHISEFPVGTYKKAHRHGPGANVLILSGVGYSLMWPEGQEKKKVDWRAGSLFVPPDKWFHQHFNTGATPARFVALKWGYKFSLGGSFAYEGFDLDVKEGGNQIEYEDQDPEIHDTYARECARNGVVVRPELGSKTGTAGN
jgi:quercetin dioxygenase-like cupin family protein